MAKEKAKELARKRAEVILSVQSGKMTATEGARALGISRKTYYEWEKRGLLGMVEALTDRPVGRPIVPKEAKAEKEDLDRSIRELSELLFLEERLEEHREILDRYPGLRDLVDRAKQSEKKTEERNG